MNGFGNWLRQIGMKFRMGLTRFMTGRYGTDKLNTFILTAGVIMCVISVFVKSDVADLALATLAYGLMFWAMFRTFSRNTYKRYQENRKFLMLVDQLKDRDHRYFNCPKCRQQVRVPKGKGKIAITCPKCKEKFIKKT
jgi:ribosomal protein L37AE/L43A